MVVGIEVKERYIDIASVVIDAEFILNVGMRMAPDTQPHVTLGRDCQFSVTP